MRGPGRMSRGMRTGTLSVRRPPLRRCSVTRTLTRLPATTRRGARAEISTSDLTPRRARMLTDARSIVGGGRSKASTSDEAAIRSSSGVNASK